MQDVDCFSQILSTYLFEFVLFYPGDQSIRQVWHIKHLIVFTIAGVMNPLKFTEDFIRIDYINIVFHLE